MPYRIKGFAEGIIWFVRQPFTKEAPVVHCWGTLATTPLPTSAFFSVDSLRLSVLKGECIFHMGSVSYITQTEA